MVFAIQGWENIFITQTKYSNRNQHGIKNTQPKIFDIDATIQNKNPKANNNEATGKTKRFVIGATSDIFPKL